MSAIKAIGNALNYDAVELAIMVPGALYNGTVSRIATMMADAAVKDESPVSYASTELATVRPAKRVA